MSKTPTGTNGSVPDSSGTDERAPNKRESRRARKPNKVQPSPAPTRDNGADRERQTPVRKRPERSGRDVSAPSTPSAENEPGGSRATDGTQKLPVNSIRPTQRRIRTAPAAASDSGPPDARVARSDPAKGRPASPEGAAAPVPARGIDPNAVPEDIQRRFIKVGRRYHFPDGERAFTDHGNRLTSHSENTEVIKSLISIAQARGWSDITIDGSERFRKEAWFAARLQGIDVRGYSPTELEEARLVRTLARSRSASEREPVSNESHERKSASVAPANAPDEARSPSPRTPAKAAERERARSLQLGRLVDHGSAPYRHDPHNPASYFIRIETPTGEREIWGVDLQRALNDSLTKVQINDEIGVRTIRRDAVKVYQPEHDDQGRVIGQREVAAHRNAWVVEKREFFRERAQVSRVLRDQSIDSKQAVKQHPELLGTYLHLRAAELAAKSLGDPAEQRRFVDSVRTALADSIARGEPLPPVPLKERAVKGTEPRSSTPTPPPEREAAPAR